MRLPRCEEVCTGITPSGVGLAFDGARASNASILARSAALEEVVSDELTFDAASAPFDGSEDTCAGGTPFVVGELFDEDEDVCNGDMPFDVGRPFDVGAPFDVGDDTCGTCWMPYSMSHIRSV